MSACSSVCHRWLPRYFSSKEQTKAHSWVHPQDLLDTKVHLWGMFWPLPGSLHDSGPPIQPLATSEGAHLFLGAVGRGDLCGASVNTWSHSPSLQPKTSDPPTHPTRAEGGCSASMAGRRLYYTGQLIPGWLRGSQGWQQGKQTVEGHPDTGQLVCLRVEHTQQTASSSQPLGAALDI